MSNPWTPGPYEVRYSTSGRPYQIRSPAKDVTRWGFFCRPSTDEARATAELFAAAPEMAELLEKMAADIREVADTSYQLEDGSIHPAEQHHYDQAVSLAVEAEVLLARIRGEQTETRPKPAHCESVTKNDDA